MAERAGTGGPRNRKRKSALGRSAMLMLEHSNPSSFAVIRRTRNSPFFMSASIQDGSKSTRAKKSGTIGSQFRRLPLSDGVPGVGVEPTRLSSVDFESTASANSATRARQGAKRRWDSARVHAKFTSTFFLNARAPPASFLPLVTRSFWEVHSLQFKSARAPGHKPGALTV
jgi:hypothetical protein